MVQAGTAIDHAAGSRPRFICAASFPKDEIGKVEVGPTGAHLISTQIPKQPLDAYVSRIDPQATFTPENTYFRDDRVKQVVGLKLQLKSGFGFAKPGMPADGEILGARRHLAAGEVDAK